MATEHCNAGSHIGSDHHFGFSEKETCLPFSCPPVIKSGAKEYIQCVTRTVCRTYSVLHVQCAAHTVCYTYSVPHIQCATHILCCTSSVLHNEPKNQVRSQKINQHSSVLAVKCAVQATLELFVGDLSVFQLISFVVEIKNIYQKYSIGYHF